MPPTNDHDASPAPIARESLLHRTRRSVLDVLMIAGMLITFSGWLLHQRGDDVALRPDRSLSSLLLGGLAVVAIISYAWRRSGARRAAAGPPDRQAARFYRTHVGSAAVAALAVPLGLAYGWWVDPRLGGVAPFWVVPLTLGFLSMPRRAELDRLEPPSEIEGPRS